MKEKTLKELRELAKARGIRGYSKLSKSALLAQLESAAERRGPAETTSNAPSRVKSERRRTPRATVAAASERAPVAPTPRQTPVEPEASDTHFASAEERVEDAKYALRPSGATRTAPAGDLNEDVDRLPALTDPVVCLLPQKPGVLHAYWVLPNREGDGERDYKLRLCRTSGATLEVQEEVPVRGERGNWYFHVGDAPADAGLLVQLGFYRDGQFHSARGRSIARLPSVYAATRTDERWWVPESDFMQMYLRAGGFVTPARRFAWNASIGSPVAPTSGHEQRLAWPGGVSSK